MTADRYLTDAQQDPIEHRQFVELLQCERVRSYLEIGCKLGGSLWRVATSLPLTSRVVAVDLPWGDQSTMPDLVACIAALKVKGYDAHLFLGDSTDPKIVAKVCELGPFDAVFIDANHTLPFVEADFRNYGGARLVAFHDIGHRRPIEPGRMPIDVPAFWERLKPHYRHAEIMLDPRGKDNGIGVLWQGEKQGPHAC